MGKGEGEGGVIYMMIFHGIVVVVVDTVGVIVIAGVHVIVVVQKGGRGEDVCIFVYENEIFFVSFNV